jgi:hypothetical protein
MPKLGISEHEIVKIAKKGTLEFLGANFGIFTLKRAHKCKLFGTILMID